MRYRSPRTALLLLAILGFGVARPAAAVPHHPPVGCYTQSSGTVGGLSGGIGQDIAISFRLGSPDRTVWIERKGDDLEARVDGRLFNGHIEGDEVELRHEFNDLTDFARFFNIEDEPPSVIRALFDRGHTVSYGFKLDSWADYHVKRDAPFNYYAYRISTGALLESAFLTKPPLPKLLRTAFGDAVSAGDATETLRRFPADEIRWYRDTTVDLVRIEPTDAGFSRPLGKIIVGQPFWIRGQAEEGGCFEARDEVIVRVFPDGREDVSIDIPLTETGRSSLEFHSPPEGTVLLAPGTPMAQKPPKKPEPAKGTAPQKADKPEEKPTRHWTVYRVETRAHGHTLDVDIVEVRYAEYGQARRARLQTIRYPVSTVTRGERIIWSIGWSSGEKESPKQAQGRTEVEQLRAEAATLRVGSMARNRVKPAVAGLFGPGSEVLAP